MVKFIPEEKMAPFLETKLSLTRAEYEQAAQQRSVLMTRLQEWIAEDQLAATELRRRNSEILQRRLEVVRHAVSKREMDSQRRFLTSQSIVARRHATEVSMQAAAAQQDWDFAEEAARQLEDGSFFLPVLPLAALTTTLEPGEDFEAQLAPGRYAVAASSTGADGRTRVWLLWTSVEEGEVNSLLLDDANLALSACSACVISPASPMVKRY